MCQIDWIMGFPDIWLSIISRCVCESVSKDICIWIGRLSKVDCCTQDGWAVNRPIRWRKERCALPSWWSWGTHLCLPFSLLVLRPSNYTTSFPRSLACRWQMVGLPSLHNFMGQCLIINFHIYVCVCVRIRCFTVLPFIVLHKYYLFYTLKVCGKLVLSDDG